MQKILLLLALPLFPAFCFAEKQLGLSEDSKKHKAMASPHTWGSMLKTHYVSHLAAGLENTAIIEGVTCLSDDIDYGDYKIIDGKLNVSDAPGFGMKLMI
jgi:L-alanine-DL-glutamate epimerase-like enolase superfamily enzyme